MTLVLAPDRCKEQIRAFLTSNFYISDIAALNDDASLLDQGIIDFDRSARGGRVHRDDFRHRRRRQ